MLELPDLEFTELAREHARHAREGQLTLQTCSACGKRQYPYRDVCRYCLCDDLGWGAVSASGTVMAVVRAHASLHPFFGQRAPWQICSVRLDAGPTVVAHLPGPALPAGSPAIVTDQRAAEERYVLVAEAGN